MYRSRTLLVAIGCFSWLLPSFVHGADEVGAGGEAVSYYEQIRPIFQAHCQGCHQPAKTSGDYVMTSFERMLSGGESGQAAIVPGKPAESYLLEQITPVDGEASMPQGKPPLSPVELELVSRWIAEGAKDDTPANAVARYDMDHPPVYTRPPVVTSVDYAPDGGLLAVAGFHEVLLVDAESGELSARLVGLSERIESVAFSPDGTRLAATGGLPGRMGEVQVWDVAERELLLSVPTTADTLYGGSWSPDGQLIAFGCPDNSVRAIDAETGEQVLFQGAHTDWVRDTVFSVDGSHLVSVGRDMTAKLTEVATQRFVDNVTSITPGALKGGITAVVRHPERDEIVIGGADGVAKIYRMHRVTERRIGDDSNLIRRLPALPGRIFSLDVSRDGARIAAVSSLDGVGELQVYNYAVEAELPDEIKTINSKRVSERTAEDQAALDAYVTQGVETIATARFDSSIYAVAFAPRGSEVAVAGADGIVRVVDAETGEVLREFSPAPVSEGAASPAASAARSSSGPLTGSTPVPSEQLPANARIASLHVEPEVVLLSGPYETVQLLITAETDRGEVLDVTRIAGLRLAGQAAEVSATGLVRPRATGRSVINVRLNELLVRVPVEVGGLEQAAPVDFIRDVNPVLSRLGCNQGTCHGAAQGKNGFKLSLRGYDPLFDVRALTDDLAARRINLASPDDSLMLLKPTGAVPHVGGVLLAPGEPYYEILRAWIADGAQLDLSTPRVASIEVSPTNPVVQLAGARQQVRVLATYGDGQVRDVTGEAFVESGNIEVATSERGGLVSALRRGEAPLLARYEGAYAATTMTVMGDRSGFEWEQPETWGAIDEFVASKWQRMKILPSELSSDADFLRRISIDLTGLPPSAEQVREFLADTRPTREKRDALIDRLVGSDEYLEHWTNKWADLLQVNRKFLGTEGAAAYRQWIRDQLAANVPYDEFAHTILTASGSNRENPAASYYKVLRTPAETMENTTHLFLAVRFNCNKCHDHPFERWTQDQYYETAAFFAQVGLKTDPMSKGQTVGGTAVEGAKPLYEEVVDTGTGEMIHERTGQPAEPEFPFDCQFDAPEDATRRQELAAWITSADNPYFARSYVNRLWGYLLGVGIMEPIDDIRAGNPPSNPELLDYLTDEFLASGFDVQHMMRLICKSRTYQLSVASNRWNEDDRTNYSHALARRLPAEVLLDSIYRVTGSLSDFPGLPRGTRAAELPDSGVELASGFLTTFGRPARESACECERSSDVQLGPVMALVSGPTVSQAIADPDNAIARLVADEPNNRRVVEGLFLRILNRPPTDDEVQVALEMLPAVARDHNQLIKALVEREAWWAPIAARKERERKAAIAAAEAELGAKQSELAPELARLEQERVDRVATLEGELEAYDQALPARLEQWEKEQQAGPAWVPLDADSVVSSYRAKFQQQPDLSQLSEGPTTRGTITFVARTELTDITGIRLEALADERLPGKGPGGASAGNFVLTELQVQASPLTDRKHLTKVQLTKPLADFSQANFEVAYAIDGDSESPNRGWAISPQMGRTHWATFETTEPVGFAEGTLLTITLHHKFRRDFTLGRFRLSITTSERPIGLGQAGDLASILSTPRGERTAEQQQMLAQEYRSRDEKYIELTASLAEARKPLGTHPEIARREYALQQAKLPVPIDPELLQLRQDAAASKEQVANRRLTAAQDLAWALINSPAFLFNH